MALHVRQRWVGDVGMDMYVYTVSMRLLANAGLACVHAHGASAWWRAGSARHAMAQLRPALALLPACPVWVAAGQARIAASTVAIRLARVAPSLACIDMPW